MAGYKFQPTDGPVCREDFLEQEMRTIGLEQDESQAKLDELYQNVLNSKYENQVALVDNWDFINWAITYGGHEEEDVSTPPLLLFTPDLAESLDSESGATPIKTIKQVEKAMDALFYQRVDSDLEYQAVLDLPLFKFPETCSAETQYAWRHSMEEYTSETFARVTLLNQERMLTDVCNWISQELVDAHTWTFKHSDGPICRANFKSTEDFYVYNSEDWSTNHAKLEAFYIKILSQLKDEGSYLVGNNDFIKFITENRPVSEISPEVKYHFFKEDGAKAFETIHDLRTALDLMYYQRAEFDLEIPAMLDPPQFASTETCSDDTEEEAHEIQSKIYDGLFNSQALLNMAVYLQSVSDWIKENKIVKHAYTPVYNRGYKPYHEFNK